MRASTSAGKSATTSRASSRTARKSAVVAVSNIGKPPAESSLLADFFLPEIQQC